MKTRLVVCFLGSILRPLCGCRTATPDARRSGSSKAEHGEDRLGELVTIPAGKFIIGSKNGAPEERPEHEVYLPTYQIAAREGGMLG